MVNKVYVHNIKAGFSYVKLGHVAVSSSYSPIFVGDRDALDSPFNDCPCFGESELVFGNLSRIVHRRCKTVIGVCSVSHALGDHLVILCSRSSSS